MWISLLGVWCVLILVGVFGYIFILDLRSVMRYYQFLLDSCIYIYILDSVINCPSGLYIDPSAREAGSRIQDD